MNTKPSRKCKFNRVFANILSIFVILVMVFPVTGSASAQEPSPGLRAFPDQDRVDGMFWPAGELVYLIIDGDLFEPQTADDTGYVEFLLTEYDLQRGDTLTMSSGEVSVTYTARQLFVEDIDQDSQTISGVVEGGQQTVHLWTGEAQLYVDANESGQWSAAFSSFGGVLFPGACGNAEAWGGPGSTIIDWCLPEPPPSPWLIAFPENDAVEGWEWPQGATVTLTIDNAPGFEWSGTAQVTSWGDPRTYFRIEFGDQYDLKIGDQVILTDEFSTATTHTVQNLSVTDVNGDADTVSGTANPGAVVQVWPHGQDYFVEDIAADGTWFADFGALGFHTIEETGGRSQIMVDSNATAVDWNVPPPPPNPFIAVSLTDHWISLSYFSPDTPVTISIYKSKGPSKPVVELNRSTDASGNLFIPSWAYNWDLEPGNFVTATDGLTTKELLLEYLTLDVFDPANDLVSGSALAGRKVDVGVGNADGEQWLTVYADEVSAVWTADFKTEGFDLTADMWAGGHVNDEDGDVTAAHNTGAPKPQFVVFPEWEWFDGNNWPDGVTVTITVKGKPECKVEKESWGGFFNGSFGEGCDVAVGDKVKFTDGKTSLTHIVRNLSITAVDPVEDTITGIADAGTLVYVWPHDGWFEPLQAIADNSGVWQVDLGDVGYDLQEGASGRSEIRDNLGDATAVDWYVPNPFFQVQLETNHVDGWEWTPNSQVTISINGVEVATVQTDEWGTFRSHFEDMEPFISGMDFLITDGLHTKTLTTADLEITNVDPDADTVSGRADAGQTFNVWVHGPENAPTVQVTADEMGQWTADFAGQWNIAPGSDGAAQIDDEDRDGTWVPWRLPNPRFTIFPLWQWHDGLDWPDGATVNITVENKPECELTKIFWGGFFNGGFPKNCYVAIGDTITFADGTTTRTHVVRDLAITAVDVDKDTISGIADAATTIYVWPHDGWFEPLQAIANNSGVWQVDLSDVGYDILEGASGRAEIRDDMGNATAVDWNLNARIVVQITDDWFRAEGFAPNTSLKFRIYDSPGGKRLLRSTTAKTDSGGTVTHWVGDQVDLVPGNFVVVSDGNTTRDIVLEALTFDVFDTTVGVLQGTAPEPFGRKVSVGIGCWQRDDLTMDVTTDENGAWTVNFGAPVPNDFGCVFAWIYETDGDVSEARPEEIIWWSE